jgi:hypothetical protein
VESTVASTRLLDALMTVGFGVLGLVSIIFSLLFLVVQWAFGSLSRCGELASARISGLRGREDVELGGLRLVQDRPERTQARARPARACWPPLR